MGRNSTGLPAGAAGVQEVKSPPRLKQNSDEEYLRKESPDGPLITNAAVTDLYMCRMTFLAPSIDIKGLQNEFHNLESVPSKKALLVKLDGGGTLVVHSFGSVVFFNVEEQKKCEDHLQVIRKYCTNPVPLLVWDSHNVAVVPTLSKPVHQELHGTVCKNFGKDQFVVTALVLGQSISLNHYGDVTTSLMDEFSRINEGVVEKGRLRLNRSEKDRNLLQVGYDKLWEAPFLERFTWAQKHKGGANFFQFQTNRHTQKGLFRFVAKNSSVYTQLLQKVTLTDVEETAWRKPECYELWDMLRTDLLLEERYESMSKKLELLQSNAQHFLSVQAAQHSGHLEWIIIFLIAMEILMNMVDVFREEVNEWRHRMFGYVRAGGSDYVDVEEEQAQNEPAALS